MQNNPLQNPNIIPAINDGSPNTESVSLATTISWHDSATSDGIPYYRQLLPKKQPGIDSKEYHTPERKSLSLSIPGEIAVVHNGYPEIADDDEASIVQLILIEMAMEKLQRVAEEDQLIAEAEAEMRRLEDARAAAEERELADCPHICHSINPKKRKKSLQPTVPPSPKITKITNSL